MIWKEFRSKIEVFDILSQKRWKIRILKKACFSWSGKWTKSHEKRHFYEIQNKMTQSPILLLNFFQIKIYTLCASRKNISSKKLIEIKSYDKKSFNQRFFASNITKNVTFTKFKIKWCKIRFSSRIFFRSKFILFALLQKKIHQKNSLQSKVMIKKFTWVSTCLYGIGNFLRWHRPAHQN